MITQTYSPEVKEVSSHSLISSRSILAEPPAFHNSDMCGGICFVPRTTRSNKMEKSAERELRAEEALFVKSGRLARITVVNIIPTAVENQALQFLITNL
jgi:sulfite exporter TauE/SafE